MGERKNEILKTAIELIVDEGYASLTMRALARACGIKLGTLQFHFRTSEDLWRDLVGHISQAYNASFTALQTQHEAPDIRQIVIFILEDKAGGELWGDRLWPQLWAMQQVEPLVSDLLEELYARYLDILEQALERQGSNAPHAEALALISMLEGSTIFMGSGRRWARDAKVVRRAILESIDHRYGTSL